MIASVGDAVAPEVGNAAPILDVAAPALGPTLNWEPVPGLPPELQPDPGDVLLSKAFWPWADLGAQGIPESWLYMTRKVQGVIAQLAVQTPNGPKLVNAQPDGTLTVGAVNLKGQTLTTHSFEGVAGDVTFGAYPFETAIAAGATFGITGIVFIGGWCCHYWLCSIDTAGLGGHSLRLKSGNDGRILAVLSTANVGTFGVPLFGRSFTGINESVVMENTAGGGITVRGTLLADNLSLG